MGIEYFTKVFPPEKEIKYKDLKNKSVIIDASTEINRAARAASRADVLRNTSGKPTLHINSILLGILLKFKSLNINQYWVFDYRCEDEKYHISLKEEELSKRRKRRQNAIKELEELHKKKTELEVNQLFSSDEEETLPSEIIECNNKIKKSEKQSFVLEQFYIDDILLMLDLLDITWFTAPAGFEAEQVCAFATFDERIVGVKVDYVLSPDADALLFGASKLLKRDLFKKKIFKYDLDNLLTENNITYEELVKIGIILGCDFAPKTPRIGAKTIFKKYKTVELTDKQKEAEIQFLKRFTGDDINNLSINNLDKESFTDY